MILLTVTPPYYRVRLVYKQIKIQVNDILPVTNELF
jgi:hypothetical protein